MDVFAFFFGTRVGVGNLATDEYASRCFGNARQAEGMRPEPSRTSTACCWAEDVEINEDPESMSGGLAALFAA